jgi:hypothetical protein
MLRALVAASLTLAFAPVSPAGAADPLLTTWVVERTSRAASELVIDGGASAKEGEYAFAAVLSATVDETERFTDAEGGMFFGITPDSDAQASTPAGDVDCDDTPAARVCLTMESGGAIGFVIWWSNATFNRAFVVLRGRNQGVGLGVGTSPGWTMRRWTGNVRVVTDADMASVETPFGRGAAAFGYAEAPGASSGSVAIGHLPCVYAGYTNAGTGAARLLGGTREVVATCADWYPPAAAATGGTEWVLDGAATGVSDVPARLVVIERPTA